MNLKSIAKGFLRRVCWRRDLLYLPDPLAARSGRMGRRAGYDRYVRLLRRNGGGGGGRGTEEPLRHIWQHEDRGI